MAIKGFVTIATGNEFFKRLAHNLKRSYDYQHQSERYPWAVLTDKNDDLLSVFDKIIILPNASCSYLDKIKMLSIPLWDENIFVDADCLIYGDISNLFSYFPINGVKHIGKCLPITATGKGWFDIENIGKYKPKVNFKIYSNGCLIFYDNSGKTLEVYNTCLDIVEHWADLKFREFIHPADEPILALSMTINDCPPIEDNMEKFLCFYRVHRRNIIQIDILKGVMSYRSKWDDVKYENVEIVHWGNSETTGYLYKSEVLKLKGVSSWQYYKLYWMLQDYYNACIGNIKSAIYGLWKRCI